ncbi:MAG: type 1 glutamine amidotransferase [Alphaproteobacteria bacterium]
MRFVVFQHHPAEHPGVYRDLMRADGVAWDTVELDQGQTIPSLDRYDAMIAMGGPQDVWQTDQYKWLVPEKAAIRGWVQARKPYLGICLGHQLLADALGGACAMMRQPEIGIFDYELNAQGQADAIFSGIATTSPCLQWHAVEVATAPPGAEILASSPACANQAMRVGERAYGMQFHVEATDTTVREWGCVPEYEAALNKSLGAGGLQMFETQTARTLASLNAQAAQVYKNFAALVRRVRVRR